MNHALEAANGAASSFTDFAAFDLPHTTRPCPARMYPFEVKDEVATLEKGYPVFRTEPWIEIYVDATQTHIVPVTDVHKRDYPTMWKRYCETQEEQSVNGYPLKEVGWLTREQIATYKALKIFAVEDLATYPIEKLDRAGPDAKKHQKQAIAWLETQKDDAATIRLAAENENLKAQVKGLTDQVNELIATMKSVLPVGQYAQPIVAPRVPLVSEEVIEKPKRTRRTKAEMAADKDKE